MEIRVLEYFLAVARCSNMTRAAQNLNVSQPTLSKQIKALENELNVKLFRRTADGMALTQEGLLLKKRVEDILSMVTKTIGEFESLKDPIGGDVYIGCAESYHLLWLANIIKELRKKYPLMKFHIVSGDTSQVTERLDRSLLDFAVIVEHPDIKKYNSIKLPGSDKWGLLMRKSSPLSEKPYIKITDLDGLPLMASLQSIETDFPRWCGDRIDELNFIGSVNLNYNGTVFVRAGAGYLLTFDKLGISYDDPELCFRPLYPPLTNNLYLIWQKHQVFSPIAEILLKEIFQKSET